MNQHSEKSPKRKKNEYRGDDPRWTQYGPTGFSAFLEQLSRRLEINVETFLVGAISLLIIALALLMDKLPLFLLSLLLAPILSPILGFAFGFNLGSLRFLKLGLFSSLLYSVSFFIVGLFSGFIGRQFPEREFLTWKYFINFDWSGLILLFVGILIMVSTIIRNPRQASLVANVALAYCFYLPLVSSGFALGHGYQQEFLTSITTFGQYFGIAILLSVVVLFVYKIHPIGLKNSWGVVSLILLTAIPTIFYIFPDFINPKEINFPILESKPVVETLFPNDNLVLENTPNPTPTESLRVDSVPDQTQVITMVPTKTATITLTPLPEIIWAEVRSPQGEGANIREEPGFSGRIISTLLNGTAVQILDEVEVVDGATWVHVRLIDQVEGWIVRSLLVSATPEPDW